MSTVLLSVDAAGSIDQYDKRAMIYAIDAENGWRASENPPLAALPKSTNAEIKTSYASCLLKLVNQQHSINIEKSNTTSLQEIRELWKQATELQRANALAALS